MNRADNDISDKQLQNNFNNGGQGYSRNYINSRSVHSISTGNSMINNPSINMPPTIYDKQQNLKRNSSSNSNSVNQKQGQLETSRRENN